MPLACMNFLAARSLPSPSLSVRSLALAAAFLAAGGLAVGQNSAPPGKGNSFRDTSMVKPPAGTKVAIFEFEDLECPACAHAFPIIHQAVDHYKIPLMRHDFPLPGHAWSFDAAITARYLQDKVAPKLAEQFRGDVFASQTAIASKDDLANFTRKWFASHGQNMPFVMDPAGLFRAEVQADRTLGDRIGLSQTPTIFVVTNKGWTQIMDPSYTYQTIDAALAETGAAKTATRASLKK